MASKLMFFAVAMVLVSLAMSADILTPKEAEIEGSRAEAVVARVRKIFGLKGLAISHCSYQR